MAALWIVENDVPLLAATPLRLSHRRYRDVPAALAFFALLALVTAVGVRALLLEADWAQFGNGPLPKECQAPSARNGTLTVELLLPAARADLLARIHREGTVLSLDYEGDMARVVATVPKRAMETLSPFVTEPSVVVE